MSQGFQNDDSFAKKCCQPLRQGVFNAVHPAADGGCDNPGARVQFDTDTDTDTIYHDWLSINKRSNPVNINLVTTLQIIEEESASDCAL